MDRKHDPWLLWLLAPFVSFGLILLILSIVTLIVGPLPFLPPSLMGAP